MFKKIYNLFLLLIMISTIHAFQARNVKFISINTTIPLKLEDSNTNLFIDRALSGALTDLARINSNAKWSFTLKVSPRNKVQNAIKKGVVMTSNRFANEVDADIVVTRSVTEVVDGVYDVFFIIESNRERLSSQNSKIISAKGISKSEQGRNLRLELLNHLVDQLNDMYPNENPLSKKEYSEAAIKKFGPKPSINNLEGTVNRNSKGIKIVIPTSEEGISFNLVSQPKNGKASLTGNSLSYTPNKGFAGQENFQYLLKNNNGMFSIASVEIKVINNSPETKNISLSVEAGESLSIDLSKYALDANGDRLNYTLLETSSSLSGTISNKGSKIIYNSNSNFSGSENLSFFASDDLGAKSNISDINIIIKKPENSDNEQIITLKNSKKKAEEDRKKAEADNKRALEDRKKAEADRKRALEDRKKAEADRKKAELLAANAKKQQQEQARDTSNKDDIEPEEDGGMNLGIILGGVLLLALLAGGGGGGGGGGIATGAIDIGILLP
tara:strand:- start:1826 stop:3325 length:1500 start_codon:yes stop_codon:yes gene_type:complete